MQRRLFLVIKKLIGGGLLFLGCIGFMLFCFDKPVQAVTRIPIAGGKYLTLMGYVNQSVGYALHNNTPDNKDEFNSFLTQAVLEAQYEASPDIVMFSSIKFNADWAYPVYSDNKEWREKGFSKARDRLFILHHFRDILGEAHATWNATENFTFRVGKQIVQWGETDGFLLMNQINPVDQRRGVSDVEFETSIIPIWLIRAEYRPPITSSWLTDFNIQFIFDPNADFAKNRSIELGADYSGIWTPGVEALPNVAYLARFRDRVSEPSQWDPQGHAYGVRLSGTVADARITLNGYYGRSHELVRSGATGFDVEQFKWDPTWLLFHLHYEAYYPYFRFVCATLS